MIQLSAIKYQGKSLVMLGGAETRWRPKTRAKNKLRLSMENILNPKFAKEKVTVIEDLSSQEDLEDEEGLDSKLLQSKKEPLVTLKQSPEKDEDLEQPKVCSTEKDSPLEVPVEEAYKEDEDDDFIFRKMNIPWLSDKTSTEKEGLCIDSDIENLQKKVKQCKYQNQFSE